MKRSNNQTTVYPDAMVVSAENVERFVFRLRLRLVRPVTEALEFVAAATDVPRDGSVDQQTLRLVKQVSREVKNKAYRKLMKAVVRAVQDGERGISAARLTANTALYHIARLTRCGYFVMTLDRALTRTVWERPASESPQPAQSNEPGSDQP